MKNNSILTWVGAGLGIALLVWGATTFRAGAPSVPAVRPITVADPSVLPGLQTGVAPWDRGMEGAGARMAASNLEQLKAEGQVLHIHQHLDIVINGQAVKVPGSIGVGAGWISPIHSHDDSGIVHIESPYVATFTLGQFFDVWGVKLTRDSIGGYVADATNKLRIYVNGDLYEGDPRTLELGERQQITIVYGTDAQVPSPIPSSYVFPKGY